MIFKVASENKSFLEFICVSIRSSPTVVAL